MTDTTDIQIPLALPAPESGDTLQYYLPGQADSLFAGTDTTGPVLHKSLFTHHNLQVRHTSEIAMHRQNTSGGFLVGILISFLFTVLYLRAKHLSISKIYHAATDCRALDRILREENLTHKADLLPVALLMPMSIALVIYHSIMPVDVTPWMALMQYLALCLGIVACYFLRNGVLRLLGNAFDNSEAVDLYISSNYIYHIAYTMVTTILAFFVCYTDIAGKTFLIILAAIIGILFLCRMVRGLNLILKLSKSPKLYLFYYLCIFEIVPILVLIKVVIS